MHIVYVIRSLKDPDRYYVGRTTDLPVRLAQHNAGASSHTSKYSPWILSVAIHFPDLRRAEAFERYLKSGSGRTFAKRHFE